MRCKIEVRRHFPHPGLKWCDRAGYSSEAEIFTKVAGVTGIIMTKLDGTARGGILVAIAERFKLPVHAIGVGEAVEDLQPFDADSFARAIAGLDQT